MVERPIFVVGSARSGTVFLGQVLKNHPDIHCMIERPDTFRFASHIALRPDIKRDRRSETVEKLWQMYATAWTMTRGNCRRCSRICKESGNVLTWWPWSTCHGHRPVRRYADKSHQHVLNTALLFEAFPDAQFLHLVRDGRDVVSSMLRHRRAVAWFGERHINRSSVFPQPWFGIDSREQFEDWSAWSLAKKCALRWVSWVRAGQTAGRQASGHQWHDLRYEALVAQPVKTGKAVFDFLDLPMHEASLAEARATSVGKWRERLNIQEVQDVLAVAGDLLEELGYTDG